MGAHTPIEWTDATWNPIGGCSIKSPGCKPCYAMQLAGTRLHKHPLYAGTTSEENGRPVFNGTMTEAVADHDVWSWPVRWRGAKTPRLGEGQRSLIFVGDMADLFHESRSHDAIDRTLAGIFYARHIGQLLTKRPHVMADYLADVVDSERWRDFPHPLLGKPNFAPEASFENVRRRLWIGASAERQREFDERWPHLRRLAEHGFTVFISYEPAMGPLDLPADFLALGRRAQVIAGGVSGRWPWAPHPDWFRQVRDQCQAAGVAFFFKQWGQYHPAADHDPKITKCLYTPKAVHVSGAREFRPFEAGWKIGEPGNGWAGMCPLGKKASGALLDGREWREFPQ